MMKTMRTLASILVMALFIMTVPALADVIPDSYVFNDGGTYLPGQRPEFVRSWLLASKLRIGSINPNPLLGPMYTQYFAIATSGGTTSYYKYNNAYYARNELAAAYVQLSELEKSISNALAKITSKSPLTRVSKESNFSGTWVNYYTGIIPVNENSSLSVGRPADFTSFITFENTANSSNPIGPVKYIFAAPLNKSNQNNVKIYLNGATTEPPMAPAIKSLLFNKFDHIGDLSNELSGNINSTYAGLKVLMKNYNSNANVTSLTIEGPTTGGGKESLKLTIQ